MEEIVPLEEHAASWCLEASDHQLFFSSAFEILLNMTPKMGFGIQAAIYIL